jgi:hypothetical protein
VVCLMSVLQVRDGRSGENARLLPNRHRPATDFQQPVG